jgi:hypothetical protein
MKGVIIAWPMESSRQGPGRGTEIRDMRQDPTVVDWRDGGEDD